MKQILLCFSIVVLIICLIMPCFMSFDSRLTRRLWWLPIVISIVAMLINLSKLLLI